MAHVTSPHRKQSDRAISAVEAGHAHGPRAAVAALGGHARLLPRRRLWLWRLAPRVWPGPGRLYAPWRTSFRHGPVHGHGELIGGARLSRSLRCWGDGLHQADMDPYQVRKCDATIGAQGQPGS